MVAAILGYFLAPFWPNWWGFMTASGLTVFAEIVGRFSPRVRTALDKIAPRYRFRFEIGLAFAGVFMAGFWAWQAEHSARLAAENQRSYRAQRHLTQDQIAKLKKSLPAVFEDVAPNVLLRIFGETPEAIRYAMEFYAIFDQQTIVGVIPPSPNAALSDSDHGVLVGLIDPNHPSERALKFIDALRNAGLDAHTTRWMGYYGKGWEIDDFDFDLFIGDQ